MVELELSTKTKESKKPNIKVIMVSILQMVEPHILFLSTMSENTQLAEGHEKVGE
jgi:hypothetical protein